ncbi:MULTISPECIES: hypothetical protein [unclassified Variovorax]|uniref:hypothetical protein n=1 Tax=unclassified Variovorax TaxID=663243 RepID=UPI000A9F2C19|nr:MULTISPECIES: hypothetical protein [unclassified Variovorax]PNG56038.1 hypothetical protein CHC07_02452 [Variovorax sp. B4]PNG57462.1 hypothetical protein CHC06_02455 [Variovorax sp. B2]VTV10160.1 hypothetical protein WDL1CHR_01175 [Variovorax sp. WDL1]
MNWKNAAVVFGCGVLASALISSVAIAKDKDEPPLQVVDAAGRTVGRLYGNAKGDFVVIRLGNAIGSLRLVEDPPPHVMPMESPNSILWTGPRCGGQAVIPTGGWLPGTGPGIGLPGVPAIGSFRGADQRFTIYLPTSSTAHRITIYSQGVPGPTCNYQVTPVDVFGVPAEAASLDSYFVLPFHIE